MTLAERVFLQFTGCQWKRLGSLPLDFVARRAANEERVKAPLVARQIPLILAGRWYEPVCEWDPADMVYASADGHVLLVETKRCADGQTPAQTLHRATYCHDLCFEKLFTVRGLVRGGRAVLEKCILGGRHDPTTTVRKLLERSAVEFAYLADGDTLCASLPYQDSPLAAIGFRCSESEDFVVLNTLCNTSVRDGYRLADIQSELDSAYREYESMKGKRPSTKRAGDKASVVALYESLPADHAVGVFWRTLHGELETRSLRYQPRGGPGADSMGISISLEVDIHRLVILYAENQEIWWNTGAMMGWMRKDWGVPNQTIADLVSSIERLVPTRAIETCACVAKIMLKRIAIPDRQRVAEEVAVRLARFVVAHRPTALN